MNYRMCDIPDDVVGNIHRVCCPSLCRRHPTSLIRLPQFGVAADVTLFTVVLQPVSDDLDPVVLVLDWAEH